MGQSNAWRGPQFCWSSAPPRGLWDIQHDSDVQLWLNHCIIQFGKTCFQKKAWDVGVWLFEVWSSPFLLTGQAILPGEWRWFLIFWCVCMGKEITYIAITGFEDLFSYVVGCSLTNTSTFMAWPVQCCCHCLLSRLIQASPAQVRWCLHCCWMLESWGWMLEHICSLLQN